MPNATRYIGVSPNHFSWDLTAISGQDFENLLSTYIAASLEVDADASIKITRTPRSHDRGSDVVVKSTSDFSVFGKRFFKHRNDELVVYFECKKTDHQLLSLNFLEDLVQFEGNAPDYYVLVTNATITPYAQTIASLDAKAKGCQFELIDRWILATAVGHSRLLEVPELPERPKGLVVEYQYERLSLEDNDRIDIYLSLRNYSTQNEMCHVSLVSDQGWLLRPDRLDVILTPNETRTFKLVAQLVDLSGLFDLRITAIIDSRPYSIQIDNNNVKYDFVAPLHGKGHIKSMRTIADWVKSKKGLSVVSVTGRSGVGKSRVIDEVAERLASPLFRFVKCHLSVNHTRESILGIFDHMNLQRPGHNCVMPELIHLLLSGIQSKFSEQMQISCVIILEDLHHADMDLIDALRQLIWAPPVVASPLALVITGRNDYTFPNDEYYSLLSLVQLREGTHVLDIRLDPLDEDDTRFLIRSAIQDVPRFAENKILRMCENIPFFIVQLVEYLLEVKMVRLINRNTVGVPNPDSFNKEDSIPATIEEIYKLRFDALRHERNGVLCQKFLVLSAFSGYTIPLALVRALFDGTEYQNTIELLVRRQFLCMHPDRQITFAHENLLHYVERFLSNDEYRFALGNLYLNSLSLREGISRFDMGRIYSLCESHVEALDCFAPILESLKNVDNFSSEDLDKSHFQYLDFLFDSMLKLQLDSELLKPIILAKAYMGVHNYNLLVGLRACEIADKWSKRAPFSAEATASLSRSIRQLTAHALLNMGRTLQAQRIMLELELSSISDLKAKTNLDLTFDLFDRLQELYRKYNHYSLSCECGRIARSVAEQTSNGKMLTCHMITQAGTHYYRDIGRAQVEADQAALLAGQFGAHRLKVYTELTRHILAAMRDHRDPRCLERAHSEIQTIAFQAARENLSDSLMRAQLAVATLTVLLRPDEEGLNIATDCVNAGIDNCLRFGNGLYIWLLYNLKAIIALQRRHIVYDDVLKSFRTALEHLRRQGFLFLGAWDICYPNLFVIQNYLRFYIEHSSEQCAAEFLMQLDYYDCVEYMSPPGVKEQLRRIRRNHLPIPARIPRCIPRDPKFHYLLPLM